MMEKQRKTALVTGAAGSLGSAACRALADCGYCVYAADLDGADIPGAASCRLDVTDEQSALRLFDRIEREAGGLDLLLHMAGVFTMDAFSECGQELPERMINVNLLGVMRLDRVMLPLIMRRGGRVIITASELAVLDPLPFNGLYSVSKRALDAYAHSLALELDLLGVRVITLYPGAYGGGMTRASLDAMERMREKTRLFRDVTGRFRSIMLSETGGANPARELAAKIVRIAQKKHPRFRYFMNNSLKLRLFSALPTGVQALCLRALLTGRLKRR